MPTLVIKCGISASTWDVGLVLLPFEWQGVFFFGVRTMGNGQRRIESLQFPSKRLRHRPSAQTAACPGNPLGLGSSHTKLSCRDLRESVALRARRPVLQRLPKLREKIGNSKPSGNGAANRVIPYLNSVQDKLKK